VSELFKGLLQFSCELLLLVAGSWGRVAVRITVEPNVENATKQRLVKTVTEKTNLCVILIFNV
jgi:hypothetical protein